ncbi:ABC transporter permease [Arenimonas daejeonensis]|uniref:ABC transporter permease n=1 Tax=Arenimonas daejeonensis TaxID=370777 RepID=UPI0013150979|nr:ABC transporter permease [Arenimonas daejeonensis]
MFHHLWQSLRRPEYWAYSSWLEITTKYRRTSLGLLWLCLPVALFVLVLGNVYSHLMGYPLEKYMPYLAIGYVIWRFMIQVVTDVAGAFPTHKANIMEGRIRLTDFILVSFSKAGFHLMFGGAVVVGVLLWSPAAHVGLLWTLLLTFPLLLANLGWIAVCIALVGARFRDTQELIGAILMLGFLLTPILWQVDRFPPDTLRGSLVRFNPAFHLIEVVRAPILGGTPEAASFWIVGLMAVAGWALTLLVYRRYARFVPLWV